MPNGSADQTRHHNKIQDHPQSFYEGFDIIIAGLDSIPARRWINATMVQIAQNSGNVVPLIDGGTEGQLSLALANLKAQRRADPYKASRVNRV